MTDAPLLAPIAQRELAKAYSRQPPAWRPLTRRTDRAHFGRKRRARRARGRRIEDREAQRFGHWFRVEIAPNRPNLLELARKIRVPVFDEIDRFLDPSMGQPWEEDSIPFSSARIALQDYWKDEQKRLTIHLIDPSIP